MGNRKVSRAVVRTNPLKNIRSMLQLNPYAAVVKKNAELTKEKNLRAKALKEAKAAGKPAPGNPMAKRKQSCQEGQEVDVVTAVPLDRLDCRCQSLGGNVLK